MAKTSLFGHILMLFVTTEFDACTRIAGTLIYESETSGQDFVNSIKFGIGISVIFSLSFSHQTQAYKHEITR